MVQQTELHDGEVDNFFQRYNFRGGSGMTGGNADSGFGIQPEKEPWEFVTVYRVSPMRQPDGSYQPYNQAVTIKRSELDRHLAKVVPEGEVGAGSKIFAMEPAKVSTKQSVKTAGVTSGVATSGDTKRRKRRRRRRKS